MSTDPTRRLAAERATIEALVAGLRVELAGIIEGQEADPPDDEHDVEGSSIGFERARVTALLASAEVALDELDAASARVEAGAYGRCEVCGNDIGADRLAALASARRCVACAIGKRRRLSG